MTTECDIWLEAGNQVVRIHQYAGHLATAFKVYRDIERCAARFVVAVDGEIASDRSVFLPDGIPKGENVRFRVTDGE